jgi:hypothetical protein
MEYSRTQREGVGVRSPQGTTNGAGRSRRVTRAPGTKPAYAFWLIVTGIASVTIIFLMTIGVFRDEFSEATEVLSALASVFAVLGTLIGAYFGVKASSDARQTAEDARQESVAVSRAALARSEPRAGTEALRDVLGDQKH